METKCSICRVALCSHTAIEINLNTIISKPPQQVQTVSGRRPTKPGLFQLRQIIQGSHSVRDVIHDDYAEKVGNQTDFIQTKVQKYRKKC